MNKKLVTLSIITVIIILIISSTLVIMYSNEGTFPKVLNKNGIMTQKIADGFEKSSGFEFVGKRDILITQKDDGKVRLIRNLDLKKYPVLDKNVFANTQDSGISGITSTTFGNVTYVFLLYTDDSVNGIGTKSPFGNGNRIYRYAWDPVTLELFDDTVVLDLPSISSATDNGGKIIIGPDSQLYTVIGVLNREGGEQNMVVEDRSEYLIKHNESESNAVLRTMIDGLPLTEKGFERSYGVGVRNSFGLTFDPLTGYLWEIEEGPGTLGKVNLIRPDLNSDSNDDFKLPQNASILWDVNGCHYINCPKFVRPNFSSVSALIFMNSSALGKEYTNDLFVGDMDGNIYHFDLDRNRKNIVIKDNLSDHIFATGFGSVSDLKIGPDDALYVLAIASNTSFPSEKDGGGMIYRIANNTIALPFLDSRAISADHLGLVVLAIIIIIILVSLTFLKKYSRKDSKPRRRFYIRRLWVL